jgi:hypothetical protein
MAPGNIDDVPDGKGMRVMKRVKILGEDRSRDIVLRVDTEPFWKECIDTSKGRRVCAIGSPGIGKTTSTPYLIRMLLEQQTTVVYLPRTTTYKGWYYRFVPSTGMAPLTMLCRVHPEEADAHLVPDLDNENTVLVVDPGTLKTLCNPDETIKARVIIVASPDNRYWGGNDFRKRKADIVTREAGVFLYYPLWSLEELLAGRPILNGALDVGDALSPEMVTTRFFSHGGVPRHVFTSNADHKALLMDKTTAVNDLTDAQARQFALTPAGTLATMTSDQPQSCLLGFAGVGSSYSDYVGVPVSRYVSSMVFKKFMREVWNEILGGQAKALFERYCMYLLAGATKQAFRARVCVGKMNLLYYSTAQVFSLGGCRDMIYRDDIVEAAQQTQNVLIVPYNLQHELIDFIYSELIDGKVHFHAFQVTSGDNHGAKVPQLKSFIARIGDAIASVYYMVLDRKYADFVTNPRNPVAGLNRSEKAKINVYHISVTGNTE